MCASLGPTCLAFELPGLPGSLLPLCYGPISIIILFDKWKEAKIVSVGAMDLIAEVGMVLDNQKE